MALVNLHQGGKERQVLIILQRKDISHWAKNYWSRVYYDLIRGDHGSSPLSRSCH